MLSSDMAKKQGEDEKIISNEVLFPGAVAILTGLIFALFSPLFSFYTSILFLLIFSQYLDRNTVKWTGYICAYSGSVMDASRKTFEASDDFAHYYNAYIHILNNGWQVIADPYGTEIGLPVIYYALSRLGIENQVYPLFAVAMLGSGLLVFWLDKYGSTNFPSARYGTMMALTLMFYGFLQATLLTRQMLSLSIVLIAISAVGWRSLAWLFGALLFHQSALLIYLMFKYAHRLKWFTVVLVLGLGIAFMLLFNRLVEIAVASDIDFIRVVSKFAYYTISEESFTSADLSGLKFVALACGAALLAARFMPQGWGLLILVVTILYILFLPYPLISLRTFLIFVAVLAGYFATFMGNRIGWSEISWLGAFYALYTLVKQFDVADNYPFPLWDKFDSIGYYPFYYFLN